MKNQTTLFLLSIISYLLIATHARNQIPTGESWVRTAVRGSESIAKLHFYVHDVRAGVDATLYRVANASITDTSPTSFGLVNVFDDLATADPDITAPQIARVQGTTASSGLEIQAVTINMNFYITSGEFSGSTVTIAGRNPVREASRELSIIGGTGVFRSARGHAITTTYLHDPEANYSILEYTLYVTYTNESLWIDM
ncbi:dirigent protein 21-like [Salvia hispanica]|uniref:dirigent protein 21-like n=1 Tax=Salvia hispanica TaxID=49212 RepID=UPI002009221A|nr:dirigent protein 21-like [Salvia hispanica]